MLANSFIWILEGKRFDRNSAIADAKTARSAFRDQLDKNEVVFQRGGEGAVTRGIETAIAEWKKARADFWDNSYRRIRGSKKGTGGKLLPQKVILSNIIKSLI